jgi:uncharacterized protein (TIGR02647 family)
MQYSIELIEELAVLAMYNLANTQEGLKIHHSAEPSSIAAAQRLHTKGLISLPDGGYLTSLGIEAADHAQAVFTILSS